MLIFRKYFAIRYQLMLNKVLKIYSDCLEKWLFHNRGRRSGRGCAQKYNANKKNNDQLKKWWPTTMMQQNTFAFPLFSSSLPFNLHMSTLFYLSLRNFPSNLINKPEIGSETGNSVNLSRIVCSLVALRLRSSHTQFKTSKSWGSAI